MTLDADKRREYQRTYYQAHKGKRKTFTSTEVKRRYNDKAYTMLSYRIPKETAVAFKAKCAALGISQAQIIKDAIDDFLKRQPPSE